MQITSNIIQVGGSIESHGSDAAVYLIHAGGSAALIDAGTGLGHDRVMQNITDAGVLLKNITHLFLTHCHFDHSGGAQMLRKATGCRIVCHELDAEFLEAGDSVTTAASWYGSHMDPLPIDVKVSERKSEFSLGGLSISFFHTPGHSPGSSVLMAVSDGKKVLFGQDVHGPLNDVLRSNRKDYLMSLEFLLSLEADILCEGYFGVFHGKEKVKDFIESFL